MAGSSPIVFKKKIAATIPNPAEIPPILAKRSPTPLATFLPGLFPMTNPPMNNEVVKIREIYSAKTLVKSKPYPKARKFKAVKVIPIRKGTV